MQNKEFIQQMRTKKHLITLFRLQNKNNTYSYYLRVYNLDNNKGIGIIKQDVNSILNLFNKLIKNN